MAHPEDSTTGRHASCLDLLAYDLATLVEEYSSIEADTENRVLSLFLEQLESKGAEPKGSLLKIDGVPYRVKIDPTGTDRVLRLYLIPWGNPSAHRKCSSFVIEHFGLIRQICVDWPDTVIAQHESLPAVLGQMVRDRYIELQVLFVSKYAQLTDSLLRSLYDVLTISIRRAGKQALSGRCWFTVTNIKSSKFQYFFSRDRIDQVTDVLITSQGPELSPFQLAVCLIADEATDTFWESHLIEKPAFVSLPFCKLTSMEAEPIHWVAEKNLFQGSDIAARQVSTVDDYLLLINCPTEISAEIEGVITDARPLLDYLFREHLKPYRAFRDRLATSAKRIRDSVAPRGLSDFVSSAIAKTVKEIVTPGP